MECNFQQNDEFWDSLNEGERAEEEEKSRRQLEWDLMLFRTLEDLQKM